MDKLATKIITEISPQSLEKIKSVSGFSLLVVKIIEKAHKRKKLSYDNAKELTDLVIDQLIERIPNNTFLVENKTVIKESVDDMIDIWDILIPKIKKFCC